MLICAEPRPNPRAFQIEAHQLLAPSVCDELLAEFEGRVWARAGAHRDHNPELDYTVGRVAAQAELSTERQAQVYPQILSIIGDLNDVVYGFQITGIPEWDRPMVFQYSARDEGRHGWHTDCGPPAATRKLSFTVQLSPPGSYEGGALEFLGGSQGPRDQGTIVVFPSFAAHQVLPVTQGTRFALVGWIHGPTFS